MLNRNFDLSYRYFFLLTTNFFRFGIVKLIFLSILFVISFSYCKNDENGLLIPEEKMIAILADIHLAEAALKSIKKHKKDSLGSMYYEQIFTIHNISRDSFENDLHILRSTPDKLEKIYSKVLEQLNKK